MLRRITFAGLFIVLAAMFTFVGCSDDSNPNGANVGDPDSPAFQPMKAAITTAIDSTLGMALKYAHKPNRFPTDIDWDRPQLGPSDSLLYNYVGGWHILYLGLTASVDYSFTYVDSARFLEGATAVQFFRADRCTGLDLIHHQMSTYSGTDTEYSDVRSYADLSFRDRLQASQHFYGHVNLELDHYREVSGQQDHVNYQFDVTANDINYTLNGTNPWYTSTVTGGQLIISVVVDNGTDSVEWDIDITFTETGAAQVDATNGTMNYEFTITPQYQ